MARLGKPALACAAIAFAVVLLVGGGLGQWLVFRLEARAEEAARRDAQALAESLARTLAAQFGKAARAGIPFAELPGVEPYLRETLRQTPGVASLALVSPTGEPISSAREASLAARERDRVELPVPGDGGPAGKIVITTAPAALAQGFAAAHRWSAVVALIAAAVAGLLAFLGPGRNLARRQAALLAGLSGSRSVDSVEQAHSGDDLDLALDAWAEGERDVAARRAAFDALAEELRAVDFDDAMRPEIERLSREIDAAMAGSTR